MVKPGDGPFAICLVVGVGFAVLAGQLENTTDKASCCSPLDSSLGAVSSIIAVLAAFFGCMKAARIEFGDPDLGPKEGWRLAVDLAIGSMHLGTRLVFFWLYPTWQFYPAFWINIRYMFYLSEVFNIVCCRKWMFLVMALERVAYVFYSLKMFDCMNSLCSVVFVPACLMAARTRYAHDQRIVLLTGALLSIASCSGNLPHDMLNMPVIGCSICTVCLFQRRARTLPPGLAGARFVRLGYLRKMVAEGTPIQRCQSLPDEAFGDPSKAAHLIVISHRWLDRYTCDLPTQEFPEGLRLRTMLQRLEADFSPPEGGCRCRSFRNFLRSYLVGGWDVVVFFDFMCLPQAGEHEPRTEPEQQVFDRCLADMAVLYSTFPVLVLSEVLPTVHRYFESGWCYSEFVTAALGRQLDVYSAEVLRSKEATASLPPCKATDIQCILTNFTAVLQTKRFVNLADVVVVKCLFHAFLLKRLLLDAILEHNVRRIENLLDHLEAADLLKEALDQPVDSTLNTLLHLAVHTGYSDVVDLLLSRGASRWIRNLRGDFPMQLFGFPQIWSPAAHTCTWSRKSAQNPSFEGGFSEKVLRLSLPDITLPDV